MSYHFTPLEFAELVFSGGNWFAPERASLESVVKTNSNGVNQDDRRLSVPSLPPILASQETSILAPLGWKG